MVAYVPQPYISDTGWVTSSSGFSTQTGWTRNAGQLRRVNDLVEFRLQYSTTTSLTFASTTGAITDQSVVQLPSAWAPTSDVRFHGEWAYRGCTVRISSTGMLIIVAIDGVGSSITYASGSSLWVSGQYFVT